MKLEDDVQVVVALAGFPNKQDALALRAHSIFVVYEAQVLVSYKTLHFYELY